MRRLKLAGAVLAVGALLLSVAPATAVAAPAVSVMQEKGKLSTLSSQQEAEIRASFEEFSVDSKQQDTLIKKIRAGQPLDAFTGANPISVEDRSTATEDVTIERFADGSFKAQSVEKAPEIISEAVTPRAVINGCSYSGGSGYAVYSGCSISANWSGIISIGFVATYQHVNGGPSSILSIGSVTSGATAWIGRGGSIGTTPAWAQAQAQVQAPWGGWTVWVQLQVRPSTATVSQS